LKNLESNLQFEDLPENLDNLKETSQESEEEIDEKRDTLVQKKGDRKELREKYTDHRVRKALLSFRRELVEDEISRLKRDFRRNKDELGELKAEAESEGSKFQTDRKPQEVLDEYGNHLGRKME